MGHCAAKLVALLLAALLAAAPCHAVAQSALDEVLERAGAMTATGKHAEAYALLAAEEDTHIGEIAFDYALGRAALHAGRPDRATLAFARVLALDPAHAGARIDSGRAYLALGNRAQAAAAFEALLALDPPPPLRQRLLAYLGEARAAPGAGGGLAARGYLGLTAGTSTNVNQAPVQGQIFVPGLLAVLQLADQNVRKDDSFVGVSGGVEAAKPVRGNLSLIGSAEFLQRVNAHESDFDTGGAAGSLGLAWGGERRLVRAQVQTVLSTLDDRTTRRVNALALDVTETPSGRGMAPGLFGFLYLGTYRHPPADLRIFDADFATVGAGAIFRAGGNSTISVAMLTGADNDKGGNPSGDREGLGGRVAWETILGPKWRLAAQAVVQDSKYDGFDPAFLVTREDRRWDFEAYLRHGFGPRLEARLGMLRSVQESNIPIYEYRRTDWSITLRRTFD
jgi:hypothetical protein